MQPTINFDGKSFNVPAGASLPLPHALGIAEEGKRWIGSRVRILPASRELMDSTTLWGNALRYPGNFNVRSGTLPKSLVLRENPPADATFVVTAVSSSRASDCYEGLGGRAASAALIPVFELGLEQPSGYNVQTQAPSFYKITVPLSHIEVLSLADEKSKLPEPGREFIAPIWDVQAHRYSKVDQSCDGFSNRPTAILAVTLKSCSVLSAEVETLRGVKGRISEKGLRQHAKRNRWEETHLSEDDYLTSGFPSHYRQSVKYEEIAEFFNQN